MDDPSDVIGGFDNQFMGNGQMVLRLRDSMTPTTIHMIKRVRDVTPDLPNNRIVFELFDLAANDWVLTEADLWRFQGVNAT